MELDNGADQQVPALIQAMAKEIYSRREPAFQQLLLTASDSLTKRRSLGSAEMARILLWSPSPGALIIEDNGWGISQEELSQDLSRLACCDARQAGAFLDDRGVDSGIGFFGRILLAGFALAEQIKIETKSCQPPRTGLVWSCAAADRLPQLEETAREGVGTRIRLQLQPDHRPLLEEQRLEKTVRTVADFLPFAVIHGRTGRQLNAVRAPWHLPMALEADYLEYFKKRFPRIKPPLDVLPLAIPEPEVRGFLYIPAEPISRKRELEIHVGRSYLGRTRKGPLPRWARFFKGVIDAPSLRVSLHRGEIWRDRAFDEIRRALESAILQRLNELIERRRKTFSRIQKIHPRYLKAAALESEPVLKVLCDGLGFSTNLRQATLAQYLQRAEFESGQKLIYYLSEKETQQHCQLLFGEKDIEVIDVADLTDEALLRRFARQNPKVRLLRIDLEAGRLFEAASQASWRGLEAVYSRLLGPEFRCQVVCFRPRRISSLMLRSRSEKRETDLRRWLRSKRASSEEEERLNEALLKKSKKRHPRDIYLNAESPVIQAALSLSREGDSQSQASLALLFRQLYFNALQMAGEPSAPGSAAQLLANQEELLLQLCEQALANRRLLDQIAELQSKASPKAAPAASSQ